MAEIPEIYLDVDGGVNAILDYVNKPHLLAHNDWEEKLVGEHRITYSPEVVNSLNVLSETAHITWLSAWKERAAKELSPAIGLNAKDFKHGEGHQSSLVYKGPEIDKRWWKLNVILDHIRNDQRPLIWVDDELHNEVQRSIRYIAVFEGVDLLMINTNIHVGLTNNDIDRIDLFMHKINIHY